ncbi:MAG: hypothetical protein QXL14_03125 [Candidatus Aenigmatarchaeota archaeon]
MKTEVVYHNGVLYFKIPEELEKELGYSNDWVAVEGIPPELRAYVSSHIEESPSNIAEIFRKLKKGQVEEFLKK